MREKRQKKAETARVSEIELRSDNTGASIRKGTQERGETLEKDPMKRRRNFISRGLRYTRWRGPATAMERQKVEKKEKKTKGGKG